MPPMGIPIDNQVGMESGNQKVQRSGKESDLSNQGSCSNSFHTLAIAEDQIVDNAQPEPGGEVLANPSLS